MEKGFWVYTYRPEESSKYARNLQVVVHKGAETNLTEYRNKVLEFNWARDISEVQAPMPVYPEMVPPEQENNDDPGKWLKWNEFRTVYYPRVQADPTDMVIFSEKVSGSFEHYFHTGLWMNTLDRYLFQYYMLKKQQLGGKMCPIEIPQEFSKKLDNYYSTAKSKRKPVPPWYQLPRPKTKKSKTSNQEIWNIPAFAGRAYLNDMARWLFTKADASGKCNELYTDGLLLRVKDSDSEDEPVPTVTIVEDFDLCSYVEHELITGISLSIEITAALLEFEDTDLRKKVFQAFCEDALAVVVGSPLIYSRISAARNFFHQILMECQVQGYQWYSSDRKPAMSGLDWGRMVRHAEEHVVMLRPNAPWVSVPENEVEVSLAHIEKLLSMVTMPDNLLEYVKTPRYGLAAFCHKTHNNINYFLNELKENDKAQITENPRKRTEAHELFMEVHAAVKTAIGKRRKVSCEKTEQ